MTYTRRFTEVGELLTKISPQSLSSGTHSDDNVSMANVRRVAIVLQVGDITEGSTVDMEIDQGTDAAMTGHKKMADKDIVTLTDVDDNKVVIVELRAEELDLANGYNTFHVYVNPSAAAYCSLLVFGLSERYKPVSVATVEEVVD